MICSISSVMLLGTASSASLGIESEEEARSGTIISEITDGDQDTNTKLDIIAQELITQLLDQHQGVFFGDPHTELSPKEFLVEMMPALKEAGVEIIYLEVIESRDQICTRYPFIITDALDDIAANESMLCQYIAPDFYGRWTGHKPDISYINLLNAANENGIRVVGIDTHNQMNRPASNKHWAEVIERENSKLSEEGKYIIFGGSAHGDRIMMRNSRSITGKTGINVELGIPSVDFQTTENTEISVLRGDGEDNDYIILLPESQYQGIGYPESNFFTFREELPVISLTLERYYSDQPESAVEQQIFDNLTQSLRTTYDLLVEQDYDGVRSSLMDLKSDLADFIDTLEVKPTTYEKMLKIYNNIDRLKQMLANTTPSPQIICPESSLLEEYQRQELNSFQVE